eukprot:TCONS_00049855-protein
MEDFKGLKVELFNSSHIKEVQDLYEEFLIPTYVKRLGLTGLGHPNFHEAEFAEEIVNSDNLNDEKYLGVSVVVYDGDKMIACSMNYLVDEELFNKEFVDYNRRLMNDYSLKPNLRKYIQHLYEVWQGHNFFSKYELEKVLYQETIIVNPKYRHHGLSGFLMNYTKDLCQSKCDGVLSDSQIPLPLYQKIVERDPNARSPIADALILRSVLSYDGFVVSVTLFLYDANDDRKSRQNSLSKL